MRTTIISSLKLKINQIIWTVIMSGLFGAVLWTTVILVIPKYSIFGISIAIIWALFYYKGLRLYWSLKSVSYDEHSVFYDKGDSEVQIPFEDIKDIEIKTLSGIYSIITSRPSLYGKKILFKLSFWDPFNLTRNNKKINLLRYKITQLKIKRDANIGLLMSGLKIGK